MFIPLKASWAADTLVNKAD